jgi:hypothetical protein
VSLPASHASGATSSDVQHTQARIRYPLLINCPPILVQVHDKDQAIPRMNLSSRRLVAKRQHRESPGGYRVAGTGALYGANARGTEQDVVMGCTFANGPRTRCARVLTRPARTGRVWLTRLRPRHSRAGLNLTLSVCRQAVPASDLTLQSMGLPQKQMVGGGLGRLGRSLWVRRKASLPEMSHHYSHGPRVDHRIGEESFFLARLLCRFRPRY